MQIIEYHHDKEYVLKYIEFIKNHYADDKRVLSYVAEIKKQLSNKNPFFRNGSIISFLAIDNNVVIGHCSAIIDKRNSEVGLIGFYDCINNETVSDSLLDRAIMYLKKESCKFIRGPINLTIWHNYRFIVNNKQSPTIFDPFCKKYYVNFWLKKGFKEASKYVSAVRTDFNYVIPFTKDAYEKCINNGIRIRAFNTKSNDFKLILTMANQIFKENWNYIELSFDEFNYLYEDLLKKIDTYFFEIVENEDKKIIGFCFTIKNPYDDSQIILKTIGVLKAYRQNHIAAALLYSQHTKAKENGFREFYYPLIKVDNNVTKFPYGGYKIITEYSAFELDLNR